MFEYASNNFNGPQQQECDFYVLRQYIVHHSMVHYTHCETVYTANIGFIFQKYIIPSSYTAIPLVLMNHNKYLKDDFFLKTKYFFFNLKTNSCMQHEEFHIVN